MLKIKLKKYVFFIMMFLSTKAYGQNGNDTLETHVIRETLHCYLDGNPNSAASFVQGNGTYETMHNYLNSLLEIKIMSDTIELQNAKERLYVVSDSLKAVLLEKHILVLIHDTLYPYEYIAEEYADLKDEEDWKVKYTYLKNDFTLNEMARLRDTISAEFVDLIKLQIDIKSAARTIELNRLNNGYYIFSANSKKTYDSTSLQFRGHKLYRPVFNKDLNKACYLFSYRCRDGFCRDFIFTELKEGKWRYVDSYPSHLIGRED